MLACRPTCHRVAVCEALAGVLAVSAVVSQTDMVRFLLEHVPKGALGPLASRSLEDLGLVIDPETMQPRCEMHALQRSSTCACARMRVRKRFSHALLAEVWSAWMAARRRWTPSARC